MSIKSILVVVVCLLVLASSLALAHEKKASSSKSKQKNNNLSGGAHAELHVEPAQIETAQVPAQVNDGDDDDEEFDKSTPLIEQARVACATIRETKLNDFEMCVHNIVMVRDVGMAGMWDHVKIIDVNDNDDSDNNVDDDAALFNTKNDKKYRNLNVTQRARLACASVLDDTAFAACVKEFHVAAHWAAHQEQRQQQADNVAQQQS